MTSKAREALTRGIEGLRAASLSTEVRASDPAGEILRRGIAVSAFNLLETFVEGRLAEITAFVNQGALHFADLPDRVQKQATRNLLNVAASRARRMQAPDVRLFVQSIGESLSAVSGAVNLSSLTWMWPGSNMGADDYAGILRAFHVDKPWPSVAALSSRIGLAPGDPQQDLESFIRERHRAAHDASHQVSSLWIPLAIDMVVKFAVSVDTYASVGAAALRRGDAAYMADANWTASVVGLRRVNQRATDWAEFKETGTRAVRRHSDRHVVTMHATNDCSDRDLLIVSDTAGQVIDWSVPAVG
ncbi:hypothetical protein ABC195_06050 [Microbacterium sp. 2P01SA-2]|uniref:hypothetical protein n=1 Tax=unclassified Microbacterium TaxID=2609290 RepID=UPI00399F639A